MTSWEPISLEELDAEINKGVSLMSETQKVFWNSIRIKPEKWNETENGEAGGGFWVVALFSDKIIWYNDIEEGFNISKYVNRGEIPEYNCEQDELQFAIKKLT